MILADGRRSAYAVMGDPSGLPVVVLHGTPGSSRQIASLDGPARDRGIAVIAPDRAGYGGSSHDPVRTMASGARDVGELVGHLGLASCAVVGLSGGGPTALACGVVLADRVSAIATVGGVAPLDPRDPSLPPDRLWIKTARRSEGAARLLFAVIVRVGRAWPERSLDRFATELAEPDARLFRDDARVRAAILDDIGNPSPTAARAAARDFYLLARRWDVDLAALSVPVHVWHGTADRNVPVEHARVIAARCPTAQLHLVEGGGHMLLDQLEAIIAGVAPREI
ncbi:MAG: alpha/beta fold hydrolase [Acidimicrobiales bacterium]|jgi:pimeloyl-ACP methyl ester carboxylesterase